MLLLKLYLLKIRSTCSILFPEYLLIKHAQRDTFFFFFFNSVLRPFQDYFSSYETGQSLGGAKTDGPREKPPGTPTSRTWLVSHVARAGLEPINKIQNKY